MNPGPRGAASSILVWGQHWAERGTPLSPLPGLSEVLLCAPHKHTHKRQPLLPTPPPRSYLRLPSLALTGALESSSQLVSTLENGLICVTVNSTKTACTLIQCFTRKQCLTLVPTNGTMNICSVCNPRSRQRAGQVRPSRGKLT